ncbi:MAG: hypothetical protein HY020_23260 [Burkholderiales bacterium]|nr:hypothetical protein [Burkholderiales bacterium]
MSTSSELLHEAKASLSGLKLREDVDEAIELFAKEEAAVSVPGVALHLSQQLSRVERILGPGQSILKVLSAAFPEVDNLLRDLETVYARGCAPGASLPVRKRAITALNKMLPRLDNLVTKIEADLKKSSTRSKVSTRASVVDEVVKGCKDSMAELRQQIQLRRKTLTSLSSAKFSKGIAVVARAQRRKAVITQVITSSGMVATAVGRAYKRLSRFGDVAGIGEVLRDDLIESIKDHPMNALVKLIDTESLMYARALGSLAAAGDKPANAKLLLKVAKAKAGIDALKGEDRQVVMGYFGRLLGMLPEEATGASRALEALGYRRAFDVLADLPEEMRAAAAGMSVEHLPGPFWAKTATRLMAEFGDGAVILRDASGNGAYLLVLGESKAGLPRELFDQIFRRSDPRAAGALLHYVTETGEFASVMLKPLPGNATPTYLFSRPFIMDEGEAKALQEMVDQGMLDGREVLKQDLPFTRKANEEFSWLLFRKSVLMLEKLGVLK